MTRYLSVLGGLAWVALASSQDSLGPRPNTVSGVVTDAVTSRPVSGAKVGVVSETSQAGLGGTAVTDQNGRYEIREVGEGTFRAWVSVPASLRATRTFQDVELHPEKHTVLNLKIEKGIQVYGTVTNRRGKPLPGTLVELDQYTSPTARDGSYALCVPAGYHALLAFGPPAGGPDRYLIEGQMPIYFSGQVPVHLNLTLFRPSDPVVTFAGTVSGPDGRPVPTAEAYIWVKGSPSAVTAVVEGGRFSFQTHSLGKEATIVIRSGSGAASDPQVMKAGVPCEFHLSADKIGVLSGRVVDARGKPFPRVSVQCHSTIGAVYYNETDSEGRYRFTNLAVGLRYRVQCKCQFQVTTGTRTVAIQPGKEGSYPDLVLPGRLTY
jgi:protocatechuate 3,4-dioxygenase beta subunit